jgi:hypothetical protein
MRSHNGPVGTYLKSIAGAKAPRSAGVIFLCWLMVLLLLSVTVSASSSPTTKRNELSMLTPLEGAPPSELITTITEPPSEWVFLAGLH